MSPASNIPRRSPIQHCLISLIERETVLPTWYDRWCTRRSHLIALSQILSTLEHVSLNLLLLLRTLLLCHPITWVTSATATHCNRPTTMPSLFMKFQYMKNISLHYNCFPALTFYNARCWTKTLKLCNKNLLEKCTYIPSTFYPLKHGKNNNVLIRSRHTTKIMACDWYLTELLDHYHSS